ncbi:hypothetical protein E8E13_001026 [Curvularia kusanoi]|uniref:Phosphoglycerate mutase-like protein n=1 Tax=Curvularia kusanoi TaxID=90978 RepID=A0A9P4T3S7_CURKU|nr:hypothetical protein E8E13_001026 [Curvularia kusanoi]
MPPTIILIRHAQAEHNVNGDWSIRDAPLTGFGKQQCLELQESLQKSELGNQIESIIVSVQRRALQTAAIALDWLIQEGVPVTPDANWQEFTDRPCDTGSPIDVISREFPQYDFSSVDPSFTDKATNGSNGPFAFTQEAVLARGRACLEALYLRPEKVVAVISHAGFLRTAICNRKFFNADWRVFDLSKDDSLETGKLVLTERVDTEKQGGGMGRSDIGVFGISEADFSSINQTWDHAET